MMSFRRKSSSPIFGVFLGGDVLEMIGTTSPTNVAEPEFADSSAWDVRQLGDARKGTTSDAWITHGL